MLQGDPVETSRLMRLTSPKYVPREWMLVRAYTAANKVLRHANRSLAVCCDAVSGPDSVLLCEV